MHPAEPRDAVKDRRRHLPRLARRPRRRSRGPGRRRRGGRRSGTPTPTCSGVDAVILPGGFSYGDYLRCGAIARFAPVMDASWSPRPAAGLPVLGICNGFQILCESHLLPGALIRNDHRKFICRDQRLRVENASTAWTSDFEAGERDHHRPQERRGRLRRRRARRSTARGRGPGRRSATSASNPNGSLRDIAGITNERGNVVGLMPHPEHAVEDGLRPVHRRARLLHLRPEAGRTA